MKCNIDSIVNAVKKLDASTNRLTPSLAGDWNDEVKESYRKYISQCRVNVEKIRSVESKMKTECEKLSSIDIDAMISSAEVTCSAIDSI